MVDDPFARGSLRVVTEREVISPAALAQRVAVARGALQAIQGARVAIAPSRDVDSIVAILALITSGRPIVLIHPKLPHDEQQRRAARAEATLVSVDALLATSAEPLPASVIEPSRDLALLFTSGTSGTPKVARLSRGAMAASAFASAEHLGTGAERWLLSIPPGHVGGLSVLTRMWLANGTVVLAPLSERALTLHQVTACSVVPTLLRRALATFDEVPANLRLVLVGGAAADPLLLARAREMGFPVRVTYGLTEAASQVATENKEGAGLRALPGVEVRVREGQIEVRGPTLFSGYLDHPPRDTHAWFNTGDLGHIEDGQLKVHGRRFDLIVTGGENVYPAMIEAQLAANGIRAIVFGRDDPEYGQQVAALVAGKDVAHVRGVIARSNARAAAFERIRAFAVTEELPLLGIGKPDRRAAANFPGTFVNV